MKWTPPHPAYLTSPLPSTMRAGWDAFVPAGDTAKVADAFYGAAAIPDPPSASPTWEGCRREHQEDGG